MSTKLQPGDRVKILIAGRGIVEACLIEKLKYFASRRDQDGVECILPTHWASFWLAKEPGSAHPYLVSVQNLEKVDA